MALGKTHIALGKGYELRVVVRISLSIFVLLWIYLTIIDSLLLIPPTTIASCYKTYHPSRHYWFPGFAECLWHSAKKLSTKLSLPSVICEQIYFHFVKWRNEQNKGYKSWEVIQLCSWKSFDLNSFGFKILFEISLPRVKTLGKVFAKCFFLTLGKEASLPSFFCRMFFLALDKELHYRVMEKKYSTNLLTLGKEPDSSSTVDSVFNEINRINL